MRTIDQFVRRDEIESQLSYAENGLTVQLIKSPRISIPQHYHKKHLLIIYETPKAIVHRLQGSENIKKLFTTGNVSIHPPGEYGEVSSINMAENELLENLLVHIEETALLKFAEINIGLSHLALKDCFYLKDPLIAEITWALNYNPIGNNLSALYQDSLCGSLFYHIIANYAHSSSYRVQTTNVLTAKVLSQIDEYITANLSQSIRLETLAGISCLSIFHFTRTFRKATGYSPYQYVLNKKVQAARKLMAQPGACASEAAYKLGFNSPGHFNAFFKKHFGVSPGHYQKKM